MQVKASELWPKNFTPIFQDIMRGGHVEYTLPGGRGSCKSSFVSELVIILLLGNPELNFLVCRKVSNTLRDSVYTQIKWAIEKLGVSEYFYCTYNPLQITVKATGQSVYFRGADDPLKIKSIKPERGYIGGLWLEEVAEFTPSDLYTIKLSTMRGGSRFYNFYTYNPPASTRAWVNTELARPRSDRLVCESSYLTVPREWLGDAFLYEAEQMKRDNPRAYENIFLGKPTGTGTNVFENVELRTITDEELGGFEWSYYGLDFGYYPDPLRFVCMSYNMAEHTLYIWGELSLLKFGNFDAADRIGRYMDEIGVKRSVRITADSAEPKSVNDFRAFGFNVRGALKGQGSLEAGFKWLQSLKKIVIDPVRAPKSADEFSLYEYERDKRTGEILTGYPQGQPDHTLAAVRYALEEIWRKRGN